MTIVEYFKKNQIEIEKLKDTFIQSLPEDIDSDILFTAIAAFASIVIKTTARESKQEEIEVAEKLVMGIYGLLPYFIKETQQ